MKIKIRNLETTKFVNDKLFRFPYYFYLLFVLLLFNFLIGDLKQNMKKN